MSPCRRSVVSPSPPGDAVAGALWDLLGAVVGGRVAWVLHVDVALA
ncbi:MAG: hypothetical protein AB7O45_16290 [Alphaproteobacteria bacterium]